MRKKNNTLFFALLFLVIGVGLIVFYIVSGGGYRDYTERTTGTVTSVIQTNFATDSDENDEFEGTVTYKVSGKEYKIDNFKLDKNYDEGADIKLAYAPDAPENAALASNVENSWVMIPVGIISIIIAAVLIIKRLRGKA